MSYNQEVKQWGTTVLSQIKTNARRYNIRHSELSKSDGSSVEKIRVAYKFEAGLISRVTIKLGRSLVYVHKGAGKGVGGVKGSRWTDRYGNKKKTNPRSLNKIGTGMRPVKPFITDALNGDNGVEELAAIVARELAQTITENIHIK